MISIGPCATTRPSRMSSTSVKSGGHLLDVVGHQDQRRGGEVGGELAEAAHEVLAPAEVEAGGRLVEQHQLGVGHQRPGDLHALALALGQRAEAAVGEVVGAERLEQLVGAALVDAVVGLAPAARRRRRRP